MEPSGLEEQMAETVLYVRPLKKLHKWNNMTGKIRFNLQLAAKLKNGLIWTTNNDVLRSASAQV